MTKFISVDNFNDAYCKNNIGQLLIVDLVEQFGIHHRQHVDHTVFPKSNDEKLWFDSNILKYSQYPSFVRYEWQIENGCCMVVYAYGGKIINLFPNKPIIVPKL